MPLPRFLAFVAAGAAGCLLALPPQIDAQVHVNTEVRTSRTTITATAPPSLAIVVNSQKLEIAPVELRSGEVKGKTPDNYTDLYEHWDPWPGKPHTPGAAKDAAPNYVSLSPHKDDDGTLLLGGLFRSFPPDSLVVKNAAGKICTIDKDFKFNDRWGQIANLNDGLGKPGAGEIDVTFKYALQRLDLVELDVAGKPKIKTGKAAQTCPELPPVDDGCTALAGIYITPWKEGNGWAVTADDIFPIIGHDPVQPINPAAIDNTIKKLKDGKTVKIAFCGDSVTLGAESGPWWADMWTSKNLSYASRVVVGLRAMYPKATIDPIPAFQGGTTTHAAMGLMEKSALPQKPDLVIIAFGLNDAAGPVGGAPNNSPEGYKADILGLVKKVKASGADVLLVAPFPGNPFLLNKMAQRIPDYRSVLLDIGKQENAGVADVYTAWLDQAKDGIPPASQVHNWINHPGVRGHAIYADTILRFFK